jgi:xylulokinase
LIPDYSASFSFHGEVTEEAAKLLGICEKVPITYKAGDQPNNAYSLNVLKSGEVATTAGTSGTIYAVSDVPLVDHQSKVNTFLHVNTTIEQPKHGVLLCVNGTGILNSWLKKLLGNFLDYHQLNELGAQSEIGARGLCFLPFGNGAERMLGNRNIGAHLRGMNFLIHEQKHVIRAAQEGIVFALAFGLNHMKEMGMSIDVIKAGHANMFLSPIFREAFVNINQVSLEIMDTDGSQGAARGAGVGVGFYRDHAEAFQHLKSLFTCIPDSSLEFQYRQAYENWLNALHHMLH